MQEILSDPTRLNALSSTGLVALIIVSILIFIFFKWYPDWTRRRDQEVSNEKEIELAKVASTTETRMKELEMFTSFHRRFDDMKDWIQAAMND